MNGTSATCTPTTLQPTATISVGHAAFETRVLSQALVSEQPWESFDRQCPEDILWVVEEQSWSHTPPNGRFLEDTRCTHFLGFTEPFGRFWGVLRSWNFSPHHPPAVRQRCFILLYPMAFYVESHHIISPRWYSLGRSANKIDQIKCCPTVARR